jgi:hypothetical protein
MRELSRELKVRRTPLDGDDALLVLGGGQHLADHVRDVAPLAVVSAVLVFRSARSSVAGRGSDDPVHPREQGRFAKHADGKIENR